MPADERERPSRPSYNVYRAGSGDDGNERPPERGGGGAPDRSQRGGGPDRPYTVYRSRRGPVAWLRSRDLGSVRERARERRQAERRKEVREQDAPERAREPRERPGWRRVLRWALIGAAAWFLLSVVLFAVSAQIQKSKLNDEAAARLGGNPLMAIFPQTILVMGTDARPEGTLEPGAEKKGRCIRGAAEGDPPGSDCLPFRADTLMLVRAGGGKFNKLSIPRDVLAAIPGHEPQKINSGYAFGGAALQIETVEDFLGIEVDHAVIVDFAGFEELIDAVGGVKVRLTERFKSKVGGGAGQGGVTLELDRGEHTLGGRDALVFARTRRNLRNPNESDINRARRQQQVLSGIRSRLTSPWRAPINFIRGPLIAWNAPKAMVSDMGGLTLPQLAFSAAIGGDSGTLILGRRNASGSASGDIVVPQEECRRAVRRFLGEPGPREPACSPAF